MLLLISAAVDATSSQLDVDSLWYLWIPFTLAKWIAILIVLEMLLLRMPMFIYNYLYYKKQGVPFVSPMLPIIGNFLKVAQVMQTEPTPDFVPFMPILEENYGKGGDFPDVVCFMMQS